MADSANTLLIYLKTIESVIFEIAPLFMEEAIEEEILTQLKNTWIKKLTNVISSDIDRNIFKCQKTEVPITITTPKNEIFMLKVPKESLTGDKLNQVLNKPVASAIINLPENIGSPILQNYIRESFKCAKKIKESTENEVMIKQKSTYTTHPTQVTHVSKFKAFTESTDGSSTSLTNSNEDNDTDENAEESLNSDDDITDCEEDKFTTENIILCQYRKIIRNKNKWKFELTNGIMNLDGMDYPFESLSGEAVW